MRFGIALERPVLRVALFVFAIVSTAGPIIAAEKTYKSIPKYPVQVFFGDPHLHTSISMDAGAWGNNLGL